MICKQHYKRNVVVGHGALRIFPPLPKEVAAAKDEMTKAMEKGIKNLPSEKNTKPKKPKEVVAMMPVPVGHVANSDESSDSGTELCSSASSESDMHDYVAAHQPDSDEEDFQAAVAGAHHDGPGGPNHSVIMEYGCGRILINQAGHSLDVKCLRCGIGFDRTWRARANARQAATKAQGRMLGSYFAFLSLECHADPEWHYSQFNATALPRVQRKALRLEAKATGLYEPLFERERDPLSDESDGEPIGIPRPVAV